MPELVAVTVRNGGSVIFEIADDEQGVRQVGRRDSHLLEHSSSFEDRLSDIHNAASTALTVLRGQLEPDEIRLRFGIKMTAEDGAVIARTAREGNLDVEMVWKPRA